MSVAHLSAPPLSVDLAEAAGRDEMVIFHCLGCSRSRDARATIFLGLLGTIPFGMLTCKLKCTRCQGALAVLLPWYAPTPHAWAKQYKPEPWRDDRPPLVPWDFALQVDSWTMDGVSIIDTRTATKSLEVATFAFEHEVKGMNPAFDRFTLRAKTLLMRDSARDLKVVADDGRKVAPFDPKTLGHSTAGQGDKG